MTGALANFGGYVVMLLGAVLFSTWWWRQMVRGDAFNTADEIDVQNIRLAIRLDRQQRRLR